MKTMNMQTALSDEVLEILIEKHYQSGGHCGTYGVDLKIRLNSDWQTIRKALLPLYKDNKILVKEGAKGKLFFANPKTLNLKKR